MESQTWLSIADSTTSSATVSILTNSNLGSYDYTIVGNLADPFSSVNSAPLHIDVVSFELPNSTPYFYLVGAKTLVMADAFVYR